MRIMECTLHSWLWVPSPILGCAFRWNRTPRWGVRNRNFCFRYQNSENFCRKTIRKKIMVSCQKIGIGISDFGIPVYYLRGT